MSVNLKKALFGEVAGDLPESVDFDGTNDYLSRSSDFVGNTDSKTFTFSCFGYLLPSPSTFQRFISIGQYNSYVQIDNTDGSIKLYFADSSGTAVIEASTGTGIWPYYTSNTLLVSIDVSSTGMRSIYLNDEDITSSFSWTTYNNTEIGFTGTTHYIAGRTTTTRCFGRISHVFLDYTYRDLSIEANRRLFITEDLKPAAGLQSLNPIMYFPLTDEADLTTNLGTGGDMVQNGVIVQSQRGPNQDNCVASKFDGVADYLRLPLSGVTNTNKIVFSCVLQLNDLSVNNLLFVQTDGPTFIIRINTNGSASIIIDNALSNQILRFSTPAGLFVEKSNDVFSFSCDLSNELLRSVRKNNTEIQGITWTTYIDDQIEFNHNDFLIAVNSTLATYNNLKLGELYLDNKHSDLSIFWDSDSNRPKPVRQVLDETGNTPLIALPLRADNPGLNLGTGGDFTEVSAPFVGARGMSEFWARSVVVDNTNYLTYSPGVLCASLIKAVSTDSGATWTISFLNNTTVTDIGNGTDNGMVGFYFGTSEVITWDETNKLRFVDALGYPIDIETDSNTLIYHKFNDSNAFNENLGSAGDPTETGTVTQGADVNP